MKNVSCSLIVAFILIGTKTLSSQIMFQDVTSASGIGSTNSTHSIVINDYNNDLFNDILVLGNDVSVLYKNNQNITFTAVSSQMSVNGTSYTAQMADFDNDCDLDVVVAGHNASPTLRLFRNDGSNSFTEITNAAGLSSVYSGFYSVAWFDYNNDGWVDLFCAGLATTNRLFRNNLGTGFSDVSDSAGLSQNQANSRGIAVGDVDGNGYVDVYVPNSGMANLLFLNHYGVFTEVASSAGVSFPSEDNFTAVFGDYDNDGDLDLLLGNSSSPYRLLKNNGMVFSDESVSSGIYRGNGQATCATFADFNNDGFLDIIAQVHSSSPSYRLVALYKNNGNGTFDDVSEQTGLVNEQQWSNTLATGDVNNDGKMDLFLGHVYSGDHLYCNVTSADSQWIKIKLNGTISNKSAIGARVYLKSGSVTQIRQVGSGNGYSSQNSLIQHFGLGASTMIDTLIIQWPSGIKHIYTNLNFYDTTLILNEIDLADPKPVTDIGQYSDYTTPNTMTLTWTDPSLFYTGDPIDTFVIDIYKNDRLVSSVSKGIQAYTDTGLIDGTFFVYSLITRHIPTDSTSNTVESDGWYAGGHPEPSVPANLVARGYVNHAQLTWRNPVTQKDGTPLDDLAKIYIYRNSVLVDSVDQSGGPDTTYDDYLGSFETDYRYQIRAVDNESPAHFSDYTDEAIAPPALILSDTVFTQTVNSGDTDSTVFWIYNHGLSTLQFFIRESQNVFTFLESDRLSNDQGDNDKPNEFQRNSGSIVSCNRAPIEQKTKSGISRTIRKNRSAGDYNAYGTDAWGGYFIAFDLTSPQNPISKGSQYGLFIDGACFSKDGSVLYAIERYSSPTFGRIDTANGSYTVIASLPAGSWTDMTTDPTDGTIYATFVDGSDNSFLYSISSSGTPTLKGQLTGVNIAIGLAADRNGQLYVFDIGGDNFFSVNKTNGSAALIGPIGFDAAYAQSMEFDPNDNTCYMAAFNYYNFEAELRMVNLSTGATTLIGPIGSGYGVEICGLGIAGTGLSWIDVNPVSGTIETGDSVEIKLYWNGQNTEKIIIPYDGYLGVMTNDPLLPVTNVRLHLEVTVGIADENIKPVSYALHSNYPNPFNPTTTIRYDQKESGKVSLRIYNTLGQEVRTLVNRYETPGYKSVAWDGKDNTGRMVSSGIYIYRIETGSFVKSRKMMMLK